MDANALRRAFTQFFVATRPHAGALGRPDPAPSPGAAVHQRGHEPVHPVLPGRGAPPFPRATSIQKCVRIRGKHDDIDLIGRTTRHLTFFEMLGNFSFGDYFKERAIPLAWELLTGLLGLDGDRLWVTVYRDDDEAADDLAGPGRGPGQPGSSAWTTTTSGRWARPARAVRARRSTTTGARSWGPDGGPAGGGGEERFVEIWNLVFMQYDRQADGTLVPLPKPNIDTGAGLERILMVLQDVPSVWETDVLRPIIARAEALTGRTYGDDAEVDVALRILADHARSVAFLISDGVFPSNEDRGYVLRRLIRRAVRQAYLLGVERPVTPTLVAAVVDGDGRGLPGPGPQRGVRDRRGGARGGSLPGHPALRAGHARSRAGRRATAWCPGPVAFRLHDTHGFPIELTREIAAERGADVDEDGFAAAMRRQQEQSGQKRKGGRLDERRRASTPTGRCWNEAGPTRFVGYTDSTATARVLDVESGRRSTATTADGEPQVEIFLDRTPFYAEGGGQVGDTGVDRDRLRAGPGGRHHLGAARA